MTSTLCDQNCRCDPDCSTDEIALFTGTLNEGPVDFSYPTCVDPDYVKVNKRGELTTSIVDGLLCVDRSNDPSEGTYYDVVDTPSSAEFDAIVSSTSTLQSLVTTPTPSPTNSAYQFSEKIIAARGNSSYLEAAGTGYLSVPAKDHRSRCAEFGRFAEYANTVTGEEGECTLYTAEIASECETSLFSGQRFGNNLWVGKTPSAVPSDTSTYALVSLSAVWIYDSSTGQYSYAGNTEVPSPVYSSSSCTCERALHSVVYTLNHTATGNIVAASAEVILTTVTADDTSSCTTASSKAQFITRYYLSDSNTASPTISPSTDAPVVSATTSSPTNTPTSSPSVATSSPTTNPTTTSTSSSSTRALEPLPKSGNPGYRVNFPVLAGNLATDSNTSNSAIERYIEGLIMLGHTSTGTCTTISETTRSRQAVKFGLTNMVGCKLQLSLTDLESICTSGLQSYFNTSVTYVGQWGNSSFLDTSQWRQVSFDAYDASAGVWGGSTTRTCTGLLNTVHWQFLTKREGSVYNPQTQILSARVKYGTNTWRFLGTNDTYSQDFMVFATAEFFEYEGSASVNSPKAPPLFPKLPHDTLYPLYTDGN